MNVFELLLVMANIIGLVYAAYSYWRTHDKNTRDAAIYAFLFIVYFVADTLIKSRELIPGYRGSIFELLFYALGLGLFVMAIMKIRMSRL